MNINLIKKYSVIFVTMIYFLSYFFQSLSFLNFNKVYAEEPVVNTNIVVLLVSQNIYEDIQEDVEWYAQDYIQGGNSDTRYNAISNAKAIVLPIDTNNIKSYEITKILENLYFDGISGETSKLVGTILIGNIPLPVINQDGYIYPSIYPYVDFEEQKFIWSDQEKYFVYNDNPKGQAEIWHGIIDFDEIGQYHDYFDKLKNYSENPGDFVDKSIWYDDIIANKRYFYHEALNSYLNNFLFAEDLGYHRYTDLMVKLMQESHNQEISELLEGFDGAEELQAATSEMNTPTMTLKNMIENGYLKPYTSLIAGKQLDNIVKNVETSNRWTETYTGSDGEQKVRTALDTHYLKMVQKDETLLRTNGGLEPIVLAFNQALEDIVDQKIQEEGYWLNEVIPLTYLKYDGEKKFNPLKPWRFKCVWKDYDAFENYYFGSKAKNIDNMQDISAYRGTFRNLDNIDGLEIQDIQSSDRPSTDLQDIDLNKKSIGGSYDIFATQIEANRGNNIMNTVNELDIYEDNKIAKRDYWNTECDKKFLGICWVKRRWAADTSPDDHLCNPGNDEEEGGCETPSDFAMRNWGGASPLNLSGIGNWAQEYNFQDAIMPVFDIAGSQEIQNAEYDANSFEGAETYARLIQKTFVPDRSKYYTKNDKELEPDLPGKGYNSSMGEDVKFTNWMPVGDLDEPNWIYNEPLKTTNFDFFDKFDSSAEWEGNIIKITKKYDNICVGRGEIFTYRTLDSRVKNDATTSSQVNGETYRIFEDNSSPSKIFYEGILDKANRLDNELDSNIQDMSNEDNGVYKEINDLSDGIKDINDNLSEIANYNLETIETMDDTQKSELANEWLGYFDQDTKDYINNNIEEIQNELIGIDGFVQNFSLNLESSFISQELYNFEINKRDLIFLSDWKNNILSKNISIKNKFNSIGGYVENIESAYNNGHRLIENIGTILGNKRENLNNLQTDTNGDFVGCEDEYKILCDAIYNLSQTIDDFDTNGKISTIANFDYQDYDLDGNVTNTINLKAFVDTPQHLNSSSISSEVQDISNTINDFEISDDEFLEIENPGMNMATSDRPIDSPKYITFKGLGGDLVNFIYPNLYKAEIFDGDGNVLSLGSPEDIESAIKDYLRQKVQKYNEYLSEQKNKKTQLYNTNKSAYDLLDNQDNLATPNREYNLMDETFLIDALKEKINDSVYLEQEMGGYDPIEFISHMIYYQNIGWQEKVVGDTILDDIQNARENFDINNKISYVVENYLVSDNDKGSFLMPGYRPNGYEVGFINSNGADYINLDNESSFAKRIQQSKKDYQENEIPNIEQTQLDEEIQNECNVPLDGGVLIFDLENMDSPWLKAVRCWREKIREKPFSFEFNWDYSQGPVFSPGYGGEDMLEQGIDEIQSQYINQLDLLNPDEDNQEVLENLDNSNPGDYQKLNKILSYTKIEAPNKNINADSATGFIKINSSIELGDVKFYVQNVGDTSIGSEDFNSNNITTNQDNYKTGTLLFDPFEGKDINFELNNPIEGTNVMVFYMCLPDTQNIENCVKKSIRLNIIPGNIENIEIDTQSNRMLKGSQMPILVKGTDQFGNNVGQLISDRFNINVSTGTLSYQSQISDNINFSNFDTAKFVLNTNDEISNNQEITINVDDNISGIEGTYASDKILVVEGNLEVSKDGELIEDLTIDLPNQNNYSFVDDFGITQTNLEELPKISLSLKDPDGDILNLDSTLSIKSSKGLIYPGSIETRKITKSQDGMTFEIEQNRFAQSSNYILSGGELSFYLMPKFVAGKDVLIISMSGIEDIQIPININPADASVVNIKSKKDEIATNSSLDAELNISDNWGNIVLEDTDVKLGILGPLGISGFDSSSEVITIQDGKLNFIITSLDRGGKGAVYGMIDNLELSEQKAGYKDITIQKKILPENDLNIMYLNLFGSDWGNQRGFLSENNKYVENLISNSDKLITTTTQLVSQDKIKKFVWTINDKLQINNIDDIETSISFDDGILIENDGIGEIKLNLENIEVQELDVSEEDLELAIDTIINKKYDDENVILYIPEDTDSIIESNLVEDNKILINNNIVLDLDGFEKNPLLKINLSEDKLSDYQVRNVSLDEKNVGRLIFSLKNTNNNLFEIELNNDEYDYNQIWTNGSKNEMGYGIFEIESQLGDNTLGYESIQDSIDSSLGIGFQNDFKNITNFGAGESVGEATIPFSSEFLINIGDPLLKRINKNETSKIYNAEENSIKDSGFDQGLGEVIYSEPNKTIFKVKEIDFNNDDLLDIIVSFTDGTIKILKNYGGNEPFKNLGDLMVLADGIKDIIVGDVDGNNYPDIIIWTKSDLLRVYKNYEGVFDVDGYPVCLNANMQKNEINENPENIGGIHQIFFEDMDQDSKLDIVTNDDLGFIKIFYGGIDNGKDNYVSDNKYNCDDGRYDRQKDNTKTVYRFGIRIDENTNVLDQSIVHWQGLDEEDNEEITSEDIGIDIDTFDNISEDNMDQVMQEALNFDISGVENQYMATQRYTKTNFGVQPVYEDADAEINYVEIGCLTGQDPVKIYKNYEDINGDILEKGDKVEVTLNIEVNEDFVGTIIDNIVGPWIIPTTGDNLMMENFWFESGIITEEIVENELKFHWDLNNGRYMIDNLNLEEGDNIKIHYRLYYDGKTDLTSIEILDIDGVNYNRFGENEETLDEYPKDEYPDIKVKPVDGCNKSLFVFFNENQDRDYAVEYVDLAQLMYDFSQESQGNLDNAMSDINNTLNENTDFDQEPNFDEIPGLDNMLESWSNLDVIGDTFDLSNVISQGGIDLSNIFNAPMDMVDGLMGDVMEQVDELMGDMCNGFDLSKYGIGGNTNCGLPVPFNQAFLGPGNYHVFGCYEITPLSETLGKGWPVLNIPGNWGPSPAGYLPFPGIFGFPFRGPTDGFLGGPKSGTYPSQFRLYLMPTLTAELGIAMCFGPYSVGTAIPDPFSSIGGNCIVTSIPMPCKKDGDLDPNTINDIPEAFLDLSSCDSTNRPCFVGENESTSSFEIVSAGPESNNMTSAIPEGSFAGGFITIETEPVTQHGYNTPESGIEINGVKLFGGADSENKIRGSQAQGLIEKVAKNRMDKQIKYIFNNLTNFKVDVYWPDFGSVFKGMSASAITEASLDAKKESCAKQKGSWNDQTKECQISEQQRCINKGKKWDENNEVCIKQTSPSGNDEAISGLEKWSNENLLSRSQVTALSDTTLANPFDQIEAMFEEVPLINIRTQNINVKVPMISTEDISAYTHMSKNWINKQQEILKEWLDIFKAIIGLCGGNTNIQNLDDLVESFKQTKEQIQQDFKNSTGNILGDKAPTDENDGTKAIGNKINALTTLNTKYDLSFLGNYDIYESCDDVGFMIKANTDKTYDSIIPNDIYLYYRKGADPELSMFTRGVSIQEKTIDDKIKISYERNNENFSNDGLCLKSISDAEKNQCVNLFLNGKFEASLNNFLSVQTNADQLIRSVKQNIETLELYKKFPVDLYERMHVGERYMSEISSIINNFFGTLSLWMKTNSNRYSQYVDAIILAMTTIQTYQAIIDLSVNWSERCSSCTNDNYDQFACKLGMICPDNLPILPIPPMKIPSIYLDLSHLNLATDIKLPKFNFVPTSVPLPSLPNLPSPPSIDVNIDAGQGLNAGLNIIEDVVVQLAEIDLNLALPAIPVIPSPPDLPEIPSFIPSVELELPVLPPAPKIPELPNEIQTTIDTAEVIGKILCIVKGNIGLVGEDSIKAKVEQMSQRTYEVPFWDELDQTLSEWNVGESSNIPSWITDTFSFLNSSEFEEVELKGFDIGVDSYVNLQYNFAGFYDFINSVVTQVNEYSSMPGQLLEQGVNELDKRSRALENKMNACVTNPISQECMGDLYTQEIQEKTEWINETTDKLENMGNSIENGFEGVKEAIQMIEAAENKLKDIQKEIELIEVKISKIENKIIEIEQEINNSQEPEQIRILKIEKETYQKELKQANFELESAENKANEQQEKINELNNKYGNLIIKYQEYVGEYLDIKGQYEAIKQGLMGIANGALDQVNNELENTDERIDNMTNFEGLQEWNAKIEQQMNEFDQEQQIRREQRQGNLPNLYKEIDPNDYISYVDYDQEIVDQNKDKLIDSLNTMKENSNDAGFDKKLDNIMKLAKTNYNIKSLDTNITDISKQYKSLINNISTNNQTITSQIKNDYDKFLYAVNNNQIKLVSDDETNISLSSKLFDMDGEGLDIIKQQENINKVYLDYYKNNIDGYLNAMDTYDNKELNMSQETYHKSKTYLKELKNKTNIAYQKLNKQKTIAQSNGGSNEGGSEDNSYTDISSYIEGTVIKTPEGNIDLANDDFVKDFQTKTIMVDINNDGDNDLILWDRNNVYIKYRNQNSEHDNINYQNDLYIYNIDSYQELLEDSEDGFVKINNEYIKLGDNNWEVKNFKYNGGSFDKIKTSWTNSSILGDEPDGYLVKMIHRVDSFNDKELVNTQQDLDKKYILVIPKGAPLTGSKISLEEGTYRTENVIGDLIFDVMYFNQNDDKIDLTIQEPPRNWQYSQIYTLSLYEDSLYLINSSSSNQIVAGPQIIADDQGPTPIINLIRPSILETIATGTSFDGYVGTYYTLRANWEDEVSIDRLWIADELGNTLVEQTDVNQKTGTISLPTLMFTGAGNVNYYFGASDNNENTRVTEVVLSIGVPDISIIDINRLDENNQESPTQIIAELDQDIDEGYVQFARERNGLRNILSGNVSGFEINKYDLEPLQTIITGGIFDIGNEIGLYLKDGNLAVEIDPETGEIKVLNGFENQVSVNLSYVSKTPMIHIVESSGETLFWLKLPSQEIVELETDLEVQDLNNEIFGDFDGGKAIIKDEQVWIYIGPNGEIYTENEVYGEYSFDDSDDTVKYTFKSSKNGSVLGYIKLKIKNLLLD